MMRIFDWLLGGESELARGVSMNWRADLLALHVASDAVIAVAFFAIPLGLLWYLRHRFGLLREYRLVAWLFGGFILAAGTSHLIGIFAIWYPLHGLQGIAKGITAILSAAAVALIWPLLPSLVKLPSTRQLAEVNERLRREAEAHEATLRELEAARSELEARVVERTQELSQVKARFETALLGARVYVFSQDRDLRYTWVYSPRGKEAAAQMIGRTDDELVPSPEHDMVVEVKRRVLASGEPADCEVSYLMPDRGALFALHVDPTFGPDGKVDGIMCAAINIGRIRSLEGEQRRLTQELSTAVQRYETALRGSNVTVYTQDRDLRYTSVSSPIFGREPEQIVGRLDDDILPVESRLAVVALKREVLDSGQAKDGEVCVNDGVVRWYDFHIEPLRDVTGGIVGLTCAAVDISGRKAGEAHLRELMREITHRSKNLLAVIQAMARQTARHAGSTEGFLDQFGARLQALAASHDLLVQESWYGASLTELVNSQLAVFLDREEPQVQVEGSATVLLLPEAAQSLGLALHELATNAAKYGALSVPAGRVMISWRRQSPEEGWGLELSWIESGGPPVAKPEHRGFGTLVIERNLARSLDAEVSLTFAPEGLQCRIAIPAANLATGR